MASGTEVPDAEGQGCRTLIVRNIPCGLDQKDALTKLDELGWRGMYDYVYVPRIHAATKRQSNCGYMFVSFTRAEFAEEFRAAVSGTRFGLGESSRSSKVCECEPARIQGAANIAMPRWRRRCPWTPDGE